MNETTPATETPSIGHNLPPEETLRDEIKTLEAELFKRFAEVLASIETTPTTIPLGDDEMAGKVAENIKIARNMLRDLKTGKDKHAKPFKDAVAEINATFVIPSEKLTKALEPVKEALDKFTAAKKEQERLARLEKERQEREEEEERRRQAKEAEEARIRAEQERQRAEEAAARAQQEREAAAARAKEEQERAERIRAERIKLEAEMKEQREKASEEMKARAEEMRKQEIAAEEARRTAREEEKARLEERRKWDEESKAHKRDQTEAARDEKLNTAAADRAGKHADRAAAAASNEQGMGRTRSDRGALATEQRRWVLTVVDVEAIDKDLIWPHLEESAIKAACGRYMQTLPRTEEARKIAGCHIEYVSSTIVR